MAIKKTLKNWLGKAKEEAGPAWEKTKEKTVEVAGKIKEEAGPAWEKTKETASDVWDKGKDKVEEARRRDEDGEPPASK